ncbi:MAG: cytochrome o ubiquinol oxidase subunit III [Chlamydiota bacterium]
MNRQGYPDTHHDVSSNTIFGFWVYLMTDCIMFATFFAAYAVLQTGTYGGPSAREIFSLPFALTETMILLTSSFTCGVAMLYAPRTEKNKLIGWLTLTFLLGVLFMAMELSEFNRLVSEGNSWQRNAFLSAYFTLIGVHGLHIVAGLLMMIVFACQLLQRGFTPAVLRRLTCLRMYWHFLYLIWIFTFTFVYLIGAK